MQPEIRTTPIEYTIAGFSLRHDPATGFGPDIMTLLGRVWPVIKSNAIPNDGINRVVYDSDEGGCTVFAGVVLGEAARGIPAAATLERKTVRLARYAVWKHVGPYRGIAATGKAMTQALRRQGHEPTSPIIEIYGHWAPDESKLETETFVALK